MSYSVYRSIMAAQTTVFFSDLPDVKDLPRTQLRDGREVRRFACRPSMDFYGPSDAAYQHEPQTLFQYECRRRPPGESLQHFTLPLLAAITER